MCMCVRENKGIIFLLPVVLAGLVYYEEHPIWSYIALIAQSSQQFVVGCISGTQIHYPLSGDGRAYHGDSHPPHQQLLSEPHSQSSGGHSRLCKSTHAGRFTKLPVHIVHGYFMTYLWLLPGSTSQCLGIG